jgi:hypothetical protein
MDQEMQERNGISRLSKFDLVTKIGFVFIHVHHFPTLQIIQTANNKLRKPLPTIETGREKISPNKNVKRN